MLLMAFRYMPRHYYYHYYHVVSRHCRFIIIITSAATCHLPHYRCFTTLHYIRHLILHLLLCHYVTCRYGGVAITISYFHMKARLPITAHCRAIAAANIGGAIKSIGYAIINIACHWHCHVIVG